MPFIWGLNSSVCYLLVNITLSASLLTWWSVLATILTLMTVSVLLNNGGFYIMKHFLLFLERKDMGLCSIWSKVSHEEFLMHRGHTHLLAKM